MGIHPWHPPEPRQEPRVNQVGRPVWGHLQVLEIRGCGSAMGQKEKQQQHDLWKTQPSDEVRCFQPWPWPLISPGGLCDGHLMWCPLLQILLQKRNSGTRRRKKTRIQIWEECTWMARKWKLNLPTLSTNPNIAPNDSQPRAPGHKYFKDYFSLIFMYLEGENHLLLMGRRNTTVDKIILLLWSMSYMGDKRTQFSVKYDAVCGCDLFLPLLWSSFPRRDGQDLWPCASC